MFKHNGKITISKYFLLSVLVICFIFTSLGFSFEYSYAVDVNESNDEVGIVLDEQDNLVNSQENEILEVDSQDSQEILAATRAPTGNTYKSIQDEVNAAHEGDTILLKGTYHSTGNDCININKRLIIKADSTAVLDGKHLSTAFNVKEGGAGTVFRNLKFINGNGDIGSAVLVNAKNVKVENCIFEDNHANRGGAVNGKYDLDIASGLIVDNCQFRRNTGYYENFEGFSTAAALGMFGVDSEVRNSIFEDNWVKGDIECYGGAIQIGLDVPGSNGKVTNCIFINNRAISTDRSSHGGAGCVRSGTEYTNCIFINNFADEGGALTFHGSGEIKNCTFINNTAGLYGGALSTGFRYDYMELTVTNCNFEGNDAPMGGAIQAKGSNILINNSNFKNNNVSENGGAIFGQAEDVTIKNSVFNSNKACIDGGAIYIKGKNTVVEGSSFVSNVAIPDVEKLDDGLGGAIYINSSLASIKGNSFRFNTARNGSAIYYDRFGEKLTLEENEFYQNQAWVYELPISAEDIYYGDKEEIKVTLFGGNNIADFDNLAVSNAIYNAADYVNIVIDGEYPIDGAINSGELYQDSREYNINVLLSVQHEDGTLVYNEMGHTSYMGEIVIDLDNLKPGKYTVLAKHYEDTYYKAITNATTFIVSPKVDNEVKKSVSKNVADFEDVVTWTITIKNHGPNDSENVTLLDVLPKGLIYLSDTSKGLYDCNTGVLTLNTLKANETFAFDITTIVNATGEIVNKANVTSNEFDTDLTNNYAEERISINPACDLGVVKSVSNSKPNYKEKINWTIEISNNGPDVAHDVVMSDLLPDSLIYVACDGNYDAKSGIWRVETLGIGEKARLIIQCIVNGTGLIENFVCVNATEFDYDLTNNNDTERIYVNPTSDLAIEKTVNASNANFRGLVKWTLTISNNGPDNATNVRVVDVLPEGFTYVSSTSTKGNYRDNVFSVDDIAVGENVVIEIVTLIETTGEFVNYANVSSDENDCDPSNNEDEEPISVNPAADLVVTKSVSDSNPSYNDIITWTIEVINNGPDVAHDIKVTDLLADTLIWIEDDSQMGYNPVTGELFIIQLDAGESYVLNITCRVNATGLICNNASVSAKEYDYNLTNNFANETIDVEKTVDVSVIKSVNDSSPNYGDLIKWTLVISNMGPDKATDVYVEDILPNGLKLISYNATKGFYDNGIWSMCCLNKGDVETLEMICRVERTGRIINLATITADERDLNQSNNEDSETIDVPLAVDLEVMIEASNTDPLFGENVKWIISVKNNGPDNATEVILEDILPDGLMFLGYESSKGIFEDDIWDIGPVNVGDVVYLNISTRCDALGEIINDVSVEAKEYDWNLANNYDEDMIDVKPVADLSIAKTASGYQYNVGDVIKYVVEIVNKGPNAAENVKVNEILDDLLKLSSFEATKGKYNKLTNVWTIDSLGDGESARLLIKAVAMGSGMLDNSVALTSDSFDNDLSNNNDSAIVEVTEKDSDDGSPNDDDSYRDDDSSDDDFPRDNDSSGNPSDEDSSRVVDTSDNALDNSNSSQNSNLVKKSSISLEKNKTGNYILVLMISLILSIVFPGVKISKK